MWCWILGEYSTNFYTGRFCFKVQLLVSLLYPFMNNTIFDRNGNPFILSTDKMITLFMPSLELCISFNCYKLFVMSFSYEQITIILECFSMVSQPQNASFYRPKWQINFRTVSYAAFPRIIGGGDCWFCASKESDYLWEGDYSREAIISNISHWKFCPEYFVVFSN